MPSGDIFVHQSTISKEGFRWEDNLPKIPFLNPPHNCLLNWTKPVGWSVVWSSVWSGGGVSSCQFGWHTCTVSKSFNCNSNIRLRIIVSSGNIYPRSFISPTNMYFTTFTQWTSSRDSEFRNQMIPSIRAPGRAGILFPRIAALPRCSKIPILLKR